MSKLEEPSLFSLEVAISHVFIRRAVICRVPLVGFRLLDYPTIGIPLLSDDDLQKIKSSAQSNPEAAERTYQLTQLQHSTGTYRFDQGKSCLLKSRVSELHTSLTSVPLYVMLLDVLSDPPKLVASCSISLDGASRRIMRDVSVQGIEVPTTHGEKDLFSLYNLMGDKVGEAEIGVRLTSLGIAILRHVSGVSEPGTVGKLDQEILSKPKVSHEDKRKNKMAESAHENRSSHKEKIEDEDKENNLTGKENRDHKSSTASPLAAVEKISKSVQFPVRCKPEKLGSTENIFCPPALYYAKQASSGAQNKGSAKALREERPHDDSGKREKHIIPRTKTNKSVQKDEEENVASHSTQTELGTESQNQQSHILQDFPILRALVEEVAKLGLQGPKLSTVEKPKPTPTKTMAAESPYTSTPVRTPSHTHKGSKKLPEPKRSLKFGMTNSMRLRIAMSKANKMKEQQVNFTKRQSTTSPRTQALGKTFVKSSHQKGKRVKMVAKACGPDESMYRQAYMSSQPTPVQPHTVFMGNLTGYEEATDQDIPHLTSESRYEYGGAQDKKTTVQDAKEGGTDIEDLVIVKEMGTPRAHSRQSQRSIEIRLPSASTEYVLGRDEEEGDWESTFSDKEKIEEIRRARKRANKEKKHSREPKFYTPPESPQSESQESSSGESSRRIGSAHANISRESQDRNLSDYSENYKYSDDFEDDKTWSTNRPSSAVTPIPSQDVIHEADEEDYNDQFTAPPEKSMDSTLTTTRTSDFVGSSANEFSQTFERQSASATKMHSSDDGLDSSSFSKGTSVATALVSKTPQSKKHPGTPKKSKIGASIPEPIPSDSPVVQSINTESSGTDQFPDPRTSHGLISKTIKQKKAAKKEIHLPEAVAESSPPSSDKKSKRTEEFHLKRSKLTPSPPFERKFSPLSSPESSKERMRRYYHHPGRRTRTPSSGTYSSDFEKPLSPVRRSDSVSSYQPSDMSEISNVRLSEDLDDNLSDILSEEQDSQLSFRSKTNTPSDGPKTHFGKPKLALGSKLGYTT